MHDWTSLYSEYSANTEVQWLILGFQRGVEDRHPLYRVITLLFRGDKNKVTVHKAMAMTILLLLCTERCKPIE